MNLQEKGERKSLPKAVVPESIVNTPAHRCHYFTSPFGDLKSAPVMVQLDARGFFPALAVRWVVPPH